MIENTCGLDHIDIVSKYLSLDFLSNIEQFKKSFGISKWISSVEQFTFRTKIVEVIISDGKISNVDELDKAIQYFGKAFVRLDSKSSKNDIFHISSSTILEDFRSSPRTNKSILENCSLTMAIREYVPNIQRDYYEVRCFIKDRIVRGITGPVGIRNEIPRNCTTDIIRTSLSKYRHIFETKNAIRCFIDSLNLIYSDCTVDLIFGKDDFQELKWSTNPEKLSRFQDKIKLVEINSPIYAFATSGIFSFDSKMHVEILLSELIDGFDYPMILSSFEDGYIVEA